MGTICRGVTVLLCLVSVACWTLRDGHAATNTTIVTEATLQSAADAAKTLPRLRALLVSWRGDLVLERYFNGATASRPANVKSVSKSLISALVGIAIDRGLLTGVQQPVSAFFPEALKDARQAAKRQITIEDLLSMRSGLEPTSNRNYGSWVRSPNWVRYVLNRPLQTAPGTNMDYSTGNTHLLSAILTRATRTSTWQFAQQSLAAPLGFRLASWTRDPQGIYFGGNEMLLTPRQMIAFGELYLNRGRHEGRQVISAHWIDESFAPRARSDWSGQFYGYGWWIRDLAGRRVYYAWGYGGQFIFVVPDLDLVVATTSSATVDDERRGHRRTVQDLVERLIVEPIASAQAATAASSAATAR